VDVGLWMTQLGGGCRHRPWGGGGIAVRRWDSFTSPSSLSVRDVLSCNDSSSISWFVGRVFLSVGPRTFHQGRDELRIISGIRESGQGLLAVGGLGESGSMSGSGAFSWDTCNRVGGGEGGGGIIGRSSALISRSAGRMVLAVGLRTFHQGRFGPRIVSGVSESGQGHWVCLIGVFCL
jgi:hypothetical protein